MKLVHSSIAANSLFSQSPSLARLPGKKKWRCKEVKIYFPHYVATNIAVMAALMKGSFAIHSKAKKFLQLCVYLNIPSRAIFLRSLRE